MKRIVIFCDGTWNTPDTSVNGKKCQTNVVKMADALTPTSKDGTLQLLYYDTGIGSEGNTISRSFDGATGTGISDNIMQAYQFIIQNYEPGDELFFFGFSRGAFTVRSLSGLIRNSGILKIENSDQIKRAYSIYRSRRLDLQPRATEATLFRKTYAIEETTILKFIGVWDTVGALGNPLLLNGILSRRNQFHDPEISSRVSYAFHALAIDEKRENFEATLWHQKGDCKNQVMEQMWFAGVHSDVGGGYPENETGLSDIALGWMLEKAQSCNLNFEPVAMTPNPLVAMHESYESFYKLKKKYFRPIGVVIPDKGNTNESVHPSAIARYTNDENYRPPNLVEYLRLRPLSS